MSALERLAETLGPELTHPTPIRLLGIFGEAEGKLSPRDCTYAFAVADLGDPLPGDEATDKKVEARVAELLGSISYHVRRMAKAKLIKPAGTRQVRGAIQHFYVLAPEGQARHKALRELLKEDPMGD